MKNFLNNTVATESSYNKKTYMSPKLTIYGNVSEITLKENGLQDQNQSGGNPNNQGWPPGHPNYVS